MSDGFAWVGTIASVVLFAIFLITKIDDCHQRATLRKAECIKQHTVEECERIERFVRSP